MNTLAQALWKVKNTRTESQVKAFVSKIRVYDILGQDEAGAWMVTEFPDLVYIRNKEVYGWPPSDDWFRRNVQEMGVMGGQYPDRIWATEGDSPSFLYVVDKGLNHPEHPEWGGWGGRFDLEKKESIRSMDWVVRSNLDETRFDPYFMLGASKEGGQAIRRWSEDINNDFAARMKWTMADSYEKANHHPVAAIGKDMTTAALILKVKAGRRVRVDASRSSDPDGDALNYDWIFYREPGTYEGSLEYVIGYDVLYTCLHKEGCSKAFLCKYNVPVGSKIAKKRPSSCVKPLISITYGTTWQGLGQKLPEWYVVLLAEYVCP